MNRKFLLSFLIILMTIGSFFVSAGFSEDSYQSPYNKACSVTKTGRLIISPTSLEFYVNQEQLKNPEPVTVRLTGFAFPNCADANCTQNMINQVDQCFYVDANGTRTTNSANATSMQCITRPGTDDPSAHHVIWPEKLDFCWIAAPTEQWININGQTAGVAVDSSDGNGSFTVTVDISKLVDSNSVYTGKTTVKEGWIQVTTTIHDPSIPGGNETYMRSYVDERIKQHVAATLSDWSIAGDLPVDQQMSTWWIPVRVYVNSLHEAQQQNVATTDWMNLTLNVPVSSDTEGALYILAEHPSLSPGQVYAYRIINGQPQFDLFSSWGNPVPGAEKLYFAQDVQHTPIAIPFSSHQDDLLKYVIPYRETNTGVSSSDIPDVKAYIPVAFGGGIRLIGMEGDWIIRAVVGDPSDITNYSSWRELLYYVLHVKPITGRWIVTEEYNGETFTYIDNGIIYPMILHEERKLPSGANLSGVWITPKGQTILTVNYSNPTDGVCKHFSIQGQRVLIENCIRKGKYDIYFTENTVWGPFEYYYRIDYFDVDTGGKIEGQWQFRAFGSQDWSTPQKFSAVTEDVVVPLDPNCNCYKGAGKVNGVATPFIVDTGAEIVFLDPNLAESYGLKNNGVMSSGCANATGTGVGGSVDGYICNVDIENEGQKQHL